MNLNPFDLRGPEFLAFYAVMTTVTIFLAWMRSRSIEAGTSEEVDTLAHNLAQDPYQIAYLRKVAPDEVLRVAIVSLLERGLIKANGSKLVTVDSDAADKARRPLDKAILTQFLTEDYATSILGDRVARGEAAVIAEDLRQRKMLPTGRIVSARVSTTIAALVFLWLLAGVKISVALSRGHTNFGFLVIMTIVATFILLVVVHRPRTKLGDQALSKLNRLFARLGSRSASAPDSGTSMDAAYACALFGMVAIPEEMKQVVQPLGIVPANTSSSGGSSCSISSSCSSGSSSSCSSGGSSCSSSSCGGGGGCGGCGGS